jgi:hypothetical protein
MTRDDFPGWTRVGTPETPTYAILFEDKGVRGSERVTER